MRFRESTSSENMFVHVPKQSKRGHMDKKILEPIVALQKLAAEELLVKCIVVAPGEVDLIELGSIFIYELLNGF
jgi:hypothetical protein